MLTKTIPKTNKGVKGFLYEMQKNWVYYLMAFPALLVVFLVNYLPYPGMIIAFQDFHFVRGIWGSDFVGLANFQFFFQSIFFFRTTFNTLWINLSTIFFVTLTSVIIAIVLNEIRKKMAVRFYQNAIFFPHFLSAVVIGHLLIHVLFPTQSGVVNGILRTFGFEPVSWLLTPEPWLAFVVITNVWRGMGFTSIVYLATISGIDEEMFEAADLDGAGRLQRIWFITLPMLIPAICMMVLLSIGTVLFGDFGLLRSIIDGPPNNPMLLPRLDIIETFVFRAIRETVDFGTAAAIGLYQSIVGFIMVIAANWIAKRFDQNYGLF
ncbi:MAG: ABC transporter permease subunit [Defluviitaleaceae bacterium]|nr:ABC transporter permease subunit [Defluviitaleaceae bacterium]